MGRAAGSQREERAAPADVPGTAAPPRRPLPAGALPQVGPGAGPRLALPGELRPTLALPGAALAEVKRAPAGSPHFPAENTALPAIRRVNSTV